eukprot:CAMPEP_0176363244 /NCGR_PEP_ID=MMETSP0126-20121128/18986_1 /TAXON_ID=141414 ORGANISM="Strombidinopsis acuminatum, Strain SPMC142" /NCGR_SAMPLE_ID=MMETSP0126 /ASSEMBLY_ACC=CAM_ASM_000229 /LENGTH=66 /DNA_ID=CAMNT_0017719471 /DNA_START=1245 /DNA_END=1445 /DNA_ORIENTATION=+
MKEEYLRTAFKLLDKDCSGKIDGIEIRMLLQGEEMKDLYTDDQIKQAIEECDIDGDGEIDFHEFLL